MWQLALRVYFYLLLTANGEAEELRRLKGGMNSYFSKLQCLLLAHPGSTVASEQNFRGRIGDIDEDFVDCIRKILPVLLAPDAIPVKAIGHTSLTGRGLLKYFKEWVNALQTYLQSGEFRPLTLYQITVNAVFSGARRDAIKYYRSEMDQTCKTGAAYLTGERLRGLHDQYKDEALKLFSDSKKMGNDKSVSPSYERLREKLDRSLKRYEEANEINRLRELTGPQCPPKERLIAGSASFVGGAIAVGAGVTLACTPVGLVAMGIAVAVGGGLAALGGAAVAADSLMDMSQESCDSAKEKDRHP